MEQVSHASSITPAQNASIPLEQQREDFKKNRFIAMPLAGTVVWALLGISAPFVSELTITWLLYIGTGAIFYLGAGLSYLTGERFFAKKAAKNSFDRLFFVGMIMSLMVFAIALPVAAIDHTTVPLSIGILAGLMWMPLSWAIEHWIGYFHTLTRTFGIVAAWYLFPDARVEAISAVIVAVYIVSLITLERRFQSIKSN
ncbi:hypothetical protein NO989_07550 [Alteromonas sp. DY56-G5]|jgi:hypothetical protein|uniref:DUF7010 family protein n=1 Tax=Alteromonas TaxID=226 RepID=UPI0001AEBB67|nr:MULTISPECIES: hypothetical protein [Alteromonas]MCH2256602.1 hypothetical protein [Alteromonas sp.]MEC7633086.1 hypothetical protein [Pseudomonadota bacterium]AFS38449.1 hypothetical protein MASE_14735 [Alteromonas macleodii ATCC 27126]AMN12822.1 hypothetical protein ACZ81_15245 [Alteromonas macleodii]MED5424645.1 hypothetical protein [Pseudomonadota bacterium]|tara:strand:+ start:333 stop:929 length:597 start_codon:yes stop_codon:yes gene_type:complete